MTLGGREAVVTGGSRSSGRAAALRCAADGADCVLLYRTNRDRAREVVDRIERLGRRALALPAELAEPAQVTARD